jgi:Transglycosylase-like domain
MRTHTRAHFPRTTGARFPRAKLVLTSISSLAVLTGLALPAGAATGTGTSPAATAVPARAIAHVTRAEVTFAAHLAHLTHTAHLAHLARLAALTHAARAVRGGTAAAPARAVSGYSTGGAFQQCVISRESGGQSQVMNASGHYGLYQFSAATWAAYGGNPASFGHASVAQQNQVFANAMATPGGASNWRPYNGC